MTSQVQWAEQAPAPQSDLSPADQEAVEQLYEELKPQAVEEYVTYILAHTPTELHVAMEEMVRADLVAAGGEPGQSEPPTVVDAPLVWQEGAILNSTLGNWTGAPTARTWQWNVNGVDVEGATYATYGVQPADVGMPAYCTQTASNAAGTSAPVTSNTVIIT